MPKMFKPLFPSGHVVSQRINTLADLEKYAHAWNLDRIQLTRGSYYSHLDAFHTSFVQLGLTRRSMRLAIKGEVPPDTITFAIIVNDASIIQQKHKITNKHLVILEHGGEVDVVFVEPIQIISISIHRQLLKNKYEQRFEETYPFTQKFEMLLCDPEILEQVKSELLSILDMIKNNAAILLLPESIEIIENNIIASILNVIHIGSRTQEEPTWIHKPHRLYKLINTRYYNDINIEQICKELDFPQRTAYLNFQKLYGISPNQYLLSVRLGKIKKTLEGADPKTTKIELIALQNGFYHMSHFAKIYKSFFGELPSKTLWKHKR